MSDFQRDIFSMPSSSNTRKDTGFEIQTIRTY